MANEDKEKVKAIFSEASEKSPVDRAEFLEQACGGNQELRNRVTALLKALDEAGNFLGSPTGIGAEGVEESLFSGHEVPGTIIDRYKLIEEIGQGGFGAVYLAEQITPVKRRVALKIIKLGMDTRQVISRFEVERQALAMMDHPNIARVLDAGSTEMGRPYFVMELVNGIPITEYCDRFKLPTSDRLRLFTQVCSAIEHAHQKGIVHRDIKPSNVLVTVQDDMPMPKVIDFGIAKATNRELTEKTLFTEFRQIIGTPEYMSPEQAELSSVDVDARADIYSLGVLLYELVTGTKPFEAKGLLRRGYGELLRVIKEVDPPPPSSPLTKSDFAEDSPFGPALRRRKAQESTNSSPFRLLDLNRNDLSSAKSTLSTDC